MFTTGCGCGLGLEASALIVKPLVCTAGCGCGLVLEAVGGAIQHRVAERLRSGGPLHNCSGLEGGPHSPGRGHQGGLESGQRVCFLIVDIAACFPACDLLNNLPSGIPELFFATPKADNDL